MKNPRIVLPGGEDFELDLLLSVGERIFWIEAKTGESRSFCGVTLRFKENQLNRFRFFVLLLT